MQHRSIAVRRACWFAAGVVLIGAIAASCGGSSASKGTATAAPSPSPAAASREVSFQADGVTVYGTLLIPSAASGRVPVALIIAGSGPTDRDGNSAALPGKIDTLKSFAETLAAAGVASLRYDKLGTGKTGLGSYASHPDDIDFNVYIDEALAAYDFVRTQPQVDPARVAVLGHSEGGLLALIVADRRRGDAAPAALVLAAPLGTPYLETIERQLTDQYRAAQAAGSISAARADAALAELGQIVASLKTAGTYPAGAATPDAGLTQIFSPGNEKFLAQAETYDPAAIAASLPATLPVLILHGEKDQQVSDADVRALAAGFARAGNSHVESDALPDADHVFKDVPGTPDAATDYTNPALAFSSGAAAKLTAFVRGALGMG